MQFWEKAEAEVINTSPSDFAPIEQEQLAKLDGERWVIFGEMVDASKK